MILYTFQEIIQNKQKSKTGQGFEFASVFGILAEKWLLRPKILYNRVYYSPPLLTYKSVPLQNLRFKFFSTKINS